MIKILNKTINWTIKIDDLKALSRTIWLKEKTIEEAIKINRSQIVKRLGGLPPIKMHCSILATDALFEAIYDYLSKNKKPIPKFLKERHKQIEKEKKEIEKRYKEWIKLEEKLSKNEKEK